MSVTISRNNQTSFSKTIGMNSDIGNINAKAGLTLEMNKNSESINASATLNTTKLTATIGDIKSGVDSKPSFSTMAASISGSGIAIPGAIGAEYSAKASLVEVSNTTTLKFGNVEIEVNTEIGIGIGIGGKIGATNSADFSAGFRAPACPGVYAGISIDIKL